MPRGPRRGDEGLVEHLLELVAGDLAEEPGQRDRQGQRRQHQALDARSRPATGKIFSSIEKTTSRITPSQ